MRFLVRSKGVAEGVSVAKRTNLSKEAAQCVADVIDRRRVGTPAQRMAHLEECLPEIASLDVTTGNQVEGKEEFVYLNTTRTLLIPPGFTISVYARIGGARFMAVTPDGNLLVSRPGSGSVVLVRPNGAGDPFVTDFATQVIGYWYWLLVI